MTGLGVVSPLGSGTVKFGEGLALGLSGLKPFVDFDLSFSRCKLAGQVEGLPGGGSRLRQMADLAAAEALGGAGWENERADLSRCAVFVSSSKGGMESFARLPLNPHFRLEDYYSHQPGTALRHTLGWTGGGGNYPLACATGAYSIGAAFDAIADGRLDAALAGSSEASLTELIWTSFEGLGVLAPCGSRAEFRGAFDRQRQGFALGEGAGVLLLESGDSLKKRKGQALARLAGWSCTADAVHAVSPDPGGTQAARCMKQAWAKAGLNLKAPNYLNAHGTGTLAGDAAESEAIRTAFESVSAGIQVSSLKPATGHLLGAAGSVEAVATVLALHQGFIPPTLNVEEPMPGLPFDLVRGKSRRGVLNSALSLSMGFGGHNVALVFERVP